MLWGGAGAWRVARHATIVDPSITVAATAAHAAVCPPNLQVRTDGAGSGT